MRFLLSCFTAILIAGVIPFGVAHCQQPTCKFVSVEPQKDRMCITYDLVGASDTKYIVTLYIQRENDPGSLRKLEMVEGDVGDGRSPGLKLTVYWDKSEFTNPIEGARYQFALEVRTADRGGIPWYMYAGAAVVGGAVYFAVKPAKAEETHDTRTIPYPPAR